MDTVVLSSLLNGALLLVCLGLLLSFCVGCGQSRRQTPNHQQGGFTIIRGKGPYPTVNTSSNNDVPRPGASNPAISLTPAFSSLRPPWQEPERRPSYTQTEDDEESTTSYENQISMSGQNDYVNEDNGYIFVFPGGTSEVQPDTISSMQKNGSQHSLDSGNNDYENIKKKPAMRPVSHDDSLPNPKPPETLDEPDEEPALQETGSGNDPDFDLCSSDNRKYIKMLDHEKGGLTPGKSQESMESDGNGSTDYVNTSPK